MRTQSGLEATMGYHLRAAGLKFEQELKFHDERRWRFDFAFPDTKIALEIHGGTWNNGAHVRGKHYESDCEKACEAAILGWRILPVTGDMVRDGRALKLVERAQCG